MKSRRLAVMSLMTCLPVIAFGQEYRCAQGDLQRRVSIVHEAGVTVPCEVHYYKDTEAPGEREVLWSAQNESGYCEARTEEFIEKLRGWGWNCQIGDEPLGVEADDTDVLSAGEEGDAQ